MDWEPPEGFAGRCAVQKSDESLALCIHMSALTGCRQWGLEGAQGALWQPVWVSGRHAALQNLITPVPMAAAPP